MSRAPDLEALYALLSGEPLCLGFDRIARLTDRQIYDVLLYPREKDGSLKAKPDRAEESFPDLPPTRENQRAVLFAVGAAAGVPAEELERVWAAKWGAPEGG